MQSDNDIVSRCIDQIQSQKLVSLPLEYAYLPVDIIAKEFTKLNSPHEHRIHYLGPRYTNTQTLHKKCAYSELSGLCAGAVDRKVGKYRLDVKRIANSFFINERLRTNHFYKTGLYYRAFQGMNPTLDFNQEFIFNGSFESANLDCVVKFRPKEYDLFLRIDSNTRGHLQWFYFSVANGHKKEKIRLNICNISKPGSLYEQEMQPYVYSRKQNQTKNEGWAQGSPQISNVSFTQKPFNYKVLSDKISTVPYCYSFQYEFDHENDEVYFAYCIPYTYSELLHDIEGLPKQLVNTYSLGRTLTGVDIPLLHITDHAGKNKEKRNILITGRIHPGESNGSHVLRGFINYLCSGEKGAGELRKLVNFYIVPMLNPDGVILGNSRCSASGRDLNRIFPCSDKELFPEIHHLKSFTSKLSNFGQILMYFDFHGHSRKKNTFFYGPVYPLSNPNYLKCRVLPRIIEKINCGFRYHSCMFSISESKKTTGRAAMFETFQIPYTYTVESSIGYYYDSQQLKVFSFNADSYAKMGAAICEGTSTFVVALDQYDHYLKERRIERERKRNLRNTARRNENKFMFQEDEILDTAKGPTLKIYYKEREQCLFVKLLEEIKTLPDPQTSQKENQQDEDELDKEASSDDHDQKEDFEVTKLKQFNNLIIQNARKDNLMSKLAADSEANDMKAFVRSGNYPDSSHNLSRSQRNWQEEEEMELMEEINMKAKPKSSHAGRARITSIPQERSSTRVEIKKKISRVGRNEIGQKLEHLNFDETQRKFEPIGLDLEDHENQKTNERRQIKIRSSTVSRSTVGRSQENKFKEDKEKGKHFSEMHFPNEEKLEQKKILRHQKTDLFRRNIERKRQQEDRTKIQNINCSELTIIKHPKKQLMAFQGAKSKRMTQFKIDDLMLNLQFRSKMLKDSVKYKDSPHQSKGKNNFMFPSSFYCMRQQLNSKKRNSSYTREHSHSQSADEPLSIMVKQFYK